jgi:hypothetical protein
MAALYQLSYSPIGFQSTNGDLPLPERLTAEHMFAEYPKV